MNYAEAYHAIEGSDVVYFAVGLPANSEMWEQRFPVMMKNVIKACLETNAKLAFFDNTYMYEKNANVQTESSPFVPVGRKSVVRAQMAEMVLKAMNEQNLQVVIGRAPEFYGPDKTQSITNTLVFDRIKVGKKAIIPVSASVLRTLIWTPDASRALALLGNTPDAYGQTWHLPVAGSLTYKKLIKKTEAVLNQKIGYHVLPMWGFKIGSLFNDQVKELMELLPRYKYNNIFNSDKFKQRFPEFHITSYDEGIKTVFNA